MTRPRARHPGAYYHVVRRIHRREFRLRPNEDLNGAIACLIADACEKTEVQVIALCVLSNHVHFLLYDPEGWLSSWMTHVHGTLARYLNYTHKTKSHVWDSQELKEQRLADLPTVAKVAAYIICNPVAAGLVNAPAAWPGLCTTLKDIGTGKGPIHMRPKAFFRKKGPVCECAMVCHECPPGTTPRKFRAMVGKALTTLLASARAKVKASGNSYFGAEAAIQVDPFDSPKTPATTNTGSKAKAIWRQLASTPKRAIAMVQQQARFRTQHAAARRQLSLNADKDDYSAHIQAIWPAGTWHQWRFFGARRRPMLTRGVFSVP